MAMLKPSELRIGNRLRPRRLLDPENIPPLGYMICAAHIAYSEEELNNDWEGISLTPEIMEKCGFEAMGDDGKDSDGWRCYYTARYNDSGKDYFCVWNDEPGYLMDNFSSAPLLYVHQLQNLYFALTGEELTIKEPA